MTYEIICSTGYFLIYTRTIWPCDILHSWWLWLGNQIRLLIRHEYLLGSNGLETVGRINRAWGERTVGKSTVYEWFQKFCEGEESLEDRTRLGRPIEVDRQAVLDTIEEHPSLTTRMLAEDFGCGHTIIENILHELGKVWKRHVGSPMSWLQHKRQNGWQLRKHCWIAKSNMPFLDQLITGDEKWISFNNTNPHHEWRYPGQKTTAIPKKDFRHEKAMLCVFWSARGVVYWELLESQTVNSEVYCLQLDQVNRALGRCRSPLIFLDDNAGPHHSHMTNAKIACLGGNVSIIPHILLIWLRQISICSGLCSIFWMEKCSTTSTNCVQFLKFSLKQKHQSFTLKE